MLKTLSLLHTLAYIIMCVCNLRSKTIHLPVDTVSTACSDTERQLTYCTLLQHHSVVDNKLVKHVVLMVIPDLWKCEWKS